MNTKVSLNGNNWKLTGWWRNQWRFLYSMELGLSQTPLIDSIPATVPGAVQADLIKAGLLPDPNYGLDSMAGEWVNNREWFLEKEFEISEGAASEKYLLCFDGLDYSGEIHLNGEKLTEFEGMFRPVEVDITGLIHTEGKNHLRVIFHTTPEIDGQFGYSNRIRHFKSRFNYIWDWCPRIVPLGIWEDVYIKVFDSVRVKDFYPRAAVGCCEGEGATGSTGSNGNEACAGRIAVKSEIEVFRSGSYTFTYIVSHEGRETCRKVFENSLRAADQTVKHEIDLQDIRLWWPNGQGEHPLYEVSLTIAYPEGKSCDRVEKRVGFRSVEFRKNPGPVEDALPYTLWINGRRVFLRGVDWVPISPFYGTVTREQYRNYLQRFKDMNCNLIRIWGGAILEKRDFYDTCDELGLMVWQEFPQSSSGLVNSPPEDPDTLKELAKVAEVFLLARRHHACHILWCGGNELMWEGFRPIDDTHINIRLLKGLVEKLDPGKYFLASSASGPVFVPREDQLGKGICHDVHGPWNFSGDPGYYRFFNKDDALFRSETGCPAISRASQLEKFKGNCKIWPPDKSNPYWMHRGAWWIQLEQLTTLFGEWNPDGSEFEQYVKASRYLQAEALRYAAEACRRREPECSGLVLWMGNEPFPNNANTSLMEYDGMPKPAYYRVRDTFSPIHASLRYDKIGYASGEEFNGRIFVTCEPEVVSVEGALEVEAQILDIRGNVLKESRMSVNGRETVMEAGSLQWKVDACEGNLFFVRITFLHSTEPAVQITYAFSVDSERPFEPLRRLKTCTLEMREASEPKKAQCKALGDSAEYIVANRSNIAAVGVFLQESDPNAFLCFSDNYFILMPGEEKRIGVIPGESFLRDGSAHRQNSMDILMEALNS